MKKIIFLFLFIIFFQAHSQVNRFVYEVKFVRDTISKNSFTNIYFLDINLKNVKFFNQELYEVDSTQNATKQFDSRISIANSLMVKRNIPSFENENYVFIDTDYLQYKTQDKQIWKISSETKSIKNYNLQKATTEFGGRKWIAWFSKDIPINQGPYKFQGLPGLIFQIEDDRKQYSFNLIEVKKLDKEYDTSRILESNFNKKPISVSIEKYNKILLNSYNNPFSEIRNKLEKGEDYTFSAYGRDIKTVKDLDELRKVIQQEKRKNYNPIELDKAVKYTE
ncbi:GLPGLI family protein [Kaistella daneshvariae]|uniref:GLPGLI family protein n=1 Tax=Kaistella daneshvariae TaxID=2487074 RepID=A0ABN5SV89_9FLAO|nr:GLPGLI family protein [Kaistella daneshvariae]AZI66184.1 GLPGLI family protein [Kaistella daneshvariae]